MNVHHTDIFQRLLNGEAVSFRDPDYFRIIKACNETRKLLVQLNTASDENEIRKLLSEITGSEVDATTMIFPPFLKVTRFPPMKGNLLFLGIFTLKRMPGSVPVPPFYKV